MLASMILKMLKSNALWQYIDRSRKNDDLKKYFLSILLKKYDFKNAWLFF